MIKLIEDGLYKLLETKKDTKVLILNDTLVFAWVSLQNIGEILVTSHNRLVTDTILASGNYRLYEVKDEPDFTDLIHLELHSGNGLWQGYLLPNGLPDKQHIRHRIIPTPEVITKA